MNAPKQVGIFPGTFDPVHNGHLQFAIESLERASLNKIFFLIEPRPRRKQGVKAFEHRLRMVQLAIKSEPRFGTIVLEQAQFTPQDTMPLLQARFKGAIMNLLMGDDMLKHLGDWPHVEELVKACHFIIGVRHDEGGALERIMALERTRGLDFKYSIFTSKFSAVSSSKIKSSLRKKGFSDDIPVIVQEYISEHGLYKPAAK